MICRIYGVKRLIWANFRLCSQRKKIKEKKENARGWYLITFTCMHLLIFEHMKNYTTKLFINFYWLCAPPRKGERQVGKKIGWGYITCYEDHNTRRQKEEISSRMTQEFSCYTACTFWLRFLEYGESYKNKMLHKAGCQIAIKKGFIRVCNEFWGFQTTYLNQGNWCNCGKGGGKTKGARELVLELVS